MVLEGRRVTSISEPPVLPGRSWDRSKLASEEKQHQGPVYVHNICIPMMNRSTQVIVYVLQSRHGDCRQSDTKITDSSRSDIRKLSSTVAL